MAITLNSPAMTRRGVLAGIGGMTFSFAFGTDGTQLLPPARAVTGSVQMSPWVRITPDGRITILTVTEMGQGSGTAIPLMIAEEMDADWNKVVLEWAPAQPELYGWPDRSGHRVMTVTGSRIPWGRSSESRSPPARPTSSETRLRACRFTGLG